MILDAYINEDSNELDYYGFINEMNDISEDLIIESHEIIKECENNHNKLFTMNLLEDYRYLKENGIILEKASDNKVKEFFKKIINAIKTWLSNIINFIDKFFDKISQKINGIDKLEAIKNPKYEASSDIEAVNFDVLTGFGWFSKLEESSYISASGYGFINGGTILRKIIGKDVFDEELDDNEIKNIFTNIIELFIGKSQDNMSVNDIMSHTKEAYKITYMKDGSNVPPLPVLIEFIKNYVKLKDLAKEIKNISKKEAEAEIEYVSDLALEFENSFQFFKDKENTEEDKAIKSKYVSKFSPIIAKVNSLNTTICSANLMMLKEGRSLAIKLAKNYKESKET